MKPERLALKRAFGETIKGVGGLEAAAEFCRVGKSVLGDAQNPNCPDRWPPLDVIADLEPLARDRDGWPHVTRALCREMGGSFVPHPAGVAAGGDLMLRAGELVKEASDVVTSLARALADKKFDTRERREVRAEINQLVELAVGMAALVDASGEQN